MNKYQQAAIDRGGQLLSTSISARKLKWKCRDGHIFWMTFYKVKRGQWCKQCGSSIGERDIRKVLQEFNIPFAQQFSLPMLPRRKYDFYFEYGNRRYIIEYDGQQHFEYVRKYHKSKAKFLESQVIDRIKTYSVWKSNLFLIRIDYTQMEHIRHHIITAVNSNCIVYLSNPEMYKYITDINITHEQLEKYF
jgi:hypothetical protein